MSITKRLIPALLALALAAALCGCGIDRQYVSEPSDSGAPPSGGVPNSPEPSPSPSPSPSPPPTPPPEPTNLVPYNGIVEHLFFHPVISYPEMAFDGDRQERGLDDYMVTVSEYNKMLESLYANDYILIDINDIWTETTNDSGQKRMVKSTLMLPEGKKPLVFSYDDVNYYQYMIENGFTYKLVIRDGQLWSYGLDPGGNEVYSQDLDAVTILDKFVRAHPDFSHNGAKGCLSLTGYEGILGYRTMTDKDDTSPGAEAARQREIAAVKPIVQMLRDTGWSFGCHSFSHFSLSKASLDSVKKDTQRWLDEVGALVGPTSIYFYPYGARPDGDDVRQTGEAFKYLQSKGFRVFASVGIESYSKIKSDISAVICDRMHPDGTTLRHHRKSYLRFYDAKLVFDHDVRPDYGNSWGS